MIYKTIKQLNLTEIAELTNISRPTIYKFIDLYNTGYGALIRHDVYLLLEFMRNNPNSSKKDIYIFYDNIFQNKEGK